MLMVGFSWDIFYRSWELGAANWNFLYIIAPTIALKPVKQPIISPPCSWLQVFKLGNRFFNLCAHMVMRSNAIRKKESFVRPVITSKISQHICKLIALSQTVTFPCFISENVSSCFFINVPIVFGCSFLFDWKCCLCRFGFVWGHPNGLSIDETKLLSTIRLPPNICESLSQTSSNQIF